MNSKLRTILLKKLEVFTRETFRETEAFIELARERLRTDGAGDLEWAEIGLRTALQSDGKSILEILLNDPANLIPGDELQPGEKLLRDREKEIETLFGRISLWRNYYYKAPTGRFPMDQALGLIESYRRRWPG